ncbi:hypothetical protein E9840_09685 [Tissierella creatinini]|nr:hypothetical protein E9840_09685 [Tissierella creatinini]TJX63872.1 hypothetical protein E8P77_13890 [Soehngenia saccharolytica]
MKRISSFILTLLLIFTTMPTIGLTEGLPDEEPIPGNPRLYLTSSRTINADPGDTVSVPITIENNSNDPAYNISISADISGNGEVYIAGSGYESISSLNPGRERKVDFKVTVDERAESGNYTMTFDVEYENDGLPPSTLSTSEKVYIRVSLVEKTPQVKVSRLDIMPSSTINPGDNLVVGFELENTGDGPAKDIKAAIKGLSNDTFTLQTGLSTKTVNLIDRGKKNYVYFELKSSKRLSPGNYEMEMDLSYKDDKNEVITEPYNFFVNVASNSDKSSRLLIQNLTFPTGSIGQNKQVNVTFDLKNQGQTPAKNIIVRAESQDQSGLVPKSLSMSRLDYIDPGTSVPLKFEFLTTKGGETKNYPIEITVEYTDELIEPDLRDGINQFVGIFAVAPEEKDPDANQPTPKLIIDKYSFEPSLVKAGENFTMNLSFFNTNSSKAVKNIKIFLTSDERTDSDSNSAGGSVFTPVDSSNTFYIESIPPKGRVEKRITMFTVPDAAAKTYTLTANFEYEDSQANPFTATELIGVPVVQQSKLETGEIGYPLEAYVGQSAPISVEFFNTGKVTLYNMMVKIEGDFQTENGQLYVGNFTSGSSEYFEGYVIPNAPGMLAGEVIFSYEDSTGQEQELRKDFSLNVMDMPMEPGFPGEEPPIGEPTGGIFSNKLLWGGLIGLIAVATGVIVHKKRKKKKLEAMEIDD